MITIRNLGGVALLLAGSTWLWLTPAFASRGVATSGTMWAVTRVLCLLTVVGFCVASWALLARHSWWEGAALGAAAVGLIALAPYLVAALHGGETTGTATWNATVHVVILAGVGVLLRVPSLEHWVSHHVMGA